MNLEYTKYQSLSLQEALAVHQEVEQKIQEAYQAGRFNLPLEEEEVE